MNRLLFLLAALLLAPLAGAQPVHLVANTGAHDAGGGGGGTSWIVNLALTEGAGVPVNTGSLGNPSAPAISWQNDGTRDFVRTFDGSGYDGQLVYEAGAAAYDFSTADEIVILYDFIPTTTLTQQHTLYWKTPSTGHEFYFRYDYNAATPSESAIRFGVGTRTVDSDGGFSTGGVKYFAHNTRHRFRWTITWATNDMTIEVLDPADDSVLETYTASVGSFSALPVFDASSELFLSGKNFNVGIEADVYEIRIGVN